MASRLPKKGVGGVASAAGSDARSRDEGDAEAHRGGAATPQTAPRDFRLRRSRCDRQPRDFKGPPWSMAPVLNLSAAVREANACGRQPDTIPASIFQQPASSSKSSSEKSSRLPAAEKVGPERSPTAPSRVLARSTLTRKTVSGKI